MLQSFRFNLKELGAAVLLTLAVACCIVAFIDRSAADGATTATVVVNRINKGDRLPIALPPQQSSRSLSPIGSARTKRIPLGCEAAFSPVADPAQAHIFLRCLS
jgi:hypothetical protein